MSPKGLWGKEFQNPAFVQLWENKVANHFLWLPRKIKYIFLVSYVYLFGKIKNKF